MGTVMAQLQGSLGVLPRHPPAAQPPPAPQASRGAPQSRTHPWEQAAGARAFSAYSSSKRERSAATWLRPGPPRATRQSEDEDGDSDPLLLLEAGDISWISKTERYRYGMFISPFTSLSHKLYPTFSSSSKAIAVLSCCHLSLSPPALPAARTHTDLPRWEPGPHLNIAQTLL